MRKIKNLTEHSVFLQDEYDNIFELPVEEEYSIEEEKSFLIGKKLINLITRREIDLKRSKAFADELSDIPLEEDPDSLFIISEFAFSVFKTAKSCRKDICTILKKDCFARNFRKRGDKNTSVVSVTKVLTFL